MSDLHSLTVLMMVCTVVLGTCVLARTEAQVKRANVSLTLLALLTAFAAVKGDIW